MAGVHGLLSGTGREPADDDTVWAHAQGISQQVALRASFCLQCSAGAPRHEHVTLLQRGSWVFNRHDARSRTRKVRSAQSSPVPVPPDITMFRRS